jgi:adenylate cyclase
VLHRPRGYTQLTEERGDRAAAGLAAELAAMAQRTSGRHGGKPVKWLGDGALELPAIHAGVSAGLVVFQDGDYYGRTVNLAARVAAHAAPGEVLATEEVVLASTGDEIVFEPIGAVGLKGFRRPMMLHRAVPDMCASGDDEALGARPRELPG